MAERFNTVVIGAGQNGLAVGYQLTQRDVDFVILDGAERIGDSWRKRWDSLVLFTWADFNNLPGMDFPADRNHLPSKDEAAAYCEAYAEKFKLPIRTGVRVEKLERRGEAYVITTNGETYEANNVVVATGSFQRPRIPKFATELDDSISQLHTSKYVSPGDVPDGDILVVGAATSGSQIAIELAKHGDRSVYLSGRKVDVLPPGKAKVARFLGIVPFIYSRPKDSFIGKKLHHKALNSGHPLINFTYKDVDRAGVERVGRTAGVKDGKPIIEGDGEPLDVAGVVWATGYHPDFSWVDLPIFEANGYPRQERGVVEESPGLFFMGLIFMYSLSSQLFMGAARDSEYVANALVARNAAQPATESDQVARAATT